MIVLIDGYNYAKFFWGKNFDRKSAQYNQLLREFAFYVKRKKQDLSQFVVVFDGGLFTQRQKEMQDGVTIVYAGNTYNADDVIVEYACSYAGRQVVVVSNDRELKKRCAAHQSYCIGVEAFSKIVHSVVYRDDVQLVADAQDSLSVQGDDIDTLMRCAPLHAFDKQEEKEAEPRIRTGSTLSKRERIELKILKKLG